MLLFTRTFIFSFLLFSFNAFAFEREQETIHINTKVEVSGQPATVFEIGEMTSANTAFYIGALLPNSTAQTYEQEEVGLDLQATVQRIYLRSDYFFNGAYQSGFFAGAFLSYTDTRIANEDKTIEEDFRGAGGGIQAGYLYRMGNITVGANVMAQGFSYDTALEKSGDDAISGLTENSVLPHHENASASINFGYTF